MISKGPRFDSGYSHRKIILIKLNVQCSDKLDIKIRKISLYQMQIRWEQSWNRHLRFLWEAVDLNTKLRKS
jgi:hypothetical protein